MKFKAGRYEVEYKTGQIVEVYLNKTQARCFNQDLMHDLGINRIVPRGS